MKTNQIAVAKTFVISFPCSHLNQHIKKEKQDGADVSPFSVAVSEIENMLEVGEVQYIPYHDTYCVKNIGACRCITASSVYSTQYITSVQPCRSSKVHVVNHDIKELICFHSDTSNTNWLARARFERAPSGF